MTGVAEVLTVRRLTRLLSIPLLWGFASACDDFRPQWVETIELRPDSAHLAVGESAVFQIEAFDDRGELLVDRAGRAQYSVRDTDAIQTDTANGQLTVTALELGEARFSVGLGRGVAEGRVFVQPAGLARIEIEGGDGPRTFPPGARPDLRVLLFDAQNDLISPEGFRISWAVGDPAIIFVGQVLGPVTNLFMRRSGSTSLRVTVGDVTTSVRINVQ